jgi:glycogen(starch) synthase
MTYLPAVTIVHVSDCYLPRVGGIETQVHALARAQVALGHTVHVVTGTRAGTMYDPVESSGAPTVHRIAMPMPLGLTWHPWPHPALRRTLFRIRPDIVHSHLGVVSPLAWRVTATAPEAGFPTVVTVHSYWAPWAQRAFAWTDVVRRWSRRHVTWSAVSGVVASRVREALPALGSIAVLPNGVDASWWRRDRPQATDDVVRIVTAARFVRWKRYGPLLDAFLDAKRRLPNGPRLELACAGDGYDRGRVQRLARGLGLSNEVRFVGRLSRDALRTLYARSDIFIQASLQEGCGVAALEARAAGLPLILRRGIGTTEWLDDGVDGIFAASDQGLADAMVLLATDTALRQRIAAHNRTVEPVVSWPVVLERVTALYHDARRGVSGLPQTTS